MKVDRQEDAIDLLDAIVFLAEHWIVIFLIPVLLAVATFIAATQFERGYTASAAIPLDTRAAPNFVAQVLERAHQTGHTGANVSAQQNAIVISASADTKQRAETSVSQAANILGAATRDTINEQNDLMARARTNLDRLNAAIDRADPQDLSPDILTVAETLREEVNRDEQQMALAQQWVAQIEALAPQAKIVGPSPILYAIVVLFVSAFSSLFACVARVSWRKARAAPGAADKIKRIRASFWLK